MEAEGQLQLQSQAGQELQRARAWLLAQMRPEASVARPPPQQSPPPVAPPMPPSLAQVDQARAWLREQVAAPTPPAAVRLELAQLCSAPAAPASTAPAAALAAQFSLPPLNLSQLTSPRNQASQRPTAHNGGGPASRHPQPRRPPPQLPPRPSPNLGRPANVQGAAIPSLRLQPSDFERMNTNADGFVSYDEFARFYRARQEQQQQPATSSGSGAEQRTPPQRPANRPTGTPPSRLSSSKASKDARGSARV